MEDRELVSLMAAIIHAVNEERGCSAEKAVESAKEILDFVEFPSKVRKE